MIAVDFHDNGGVTDSTAYVVDDSTCSLSTCTASSVMAQDWVDN
jgi:hypothetical protein